MEVPKMLYLQASPILRFYLPTAHPHFQTRLPSLITVIQLFTLVIVIVDVMFTV
jgi:hypothetical protein